MFELRLRESRSKNGVLTLSVPPAARAAFAGIAAAIGASAFVSGEALDLPGAALLAVSAAAALYEERWSFDPGKRLAVFRFGLLFLARRRTLPFDSVEAAATELFEKGSRPGTGAGEERKGFFRPKRYARLVLRLKDAERLVVETVPAAELGRLEGMAGRIARLTGAELQSGSW